MRFRSLAILSIISLSGCAAPPDPNMDVDGLSAQRAEAVKQALTAEGVDATRITTAADGITDPKTLPTLAGRRVDITIGQPEAPNAPAPMQDSSVK
jgi:hypothetical protein